VVEVSQRYDNLPACALGSQCNITLTIPAAMQAPVYFYYQLANFYQNHRRYVKSRADAQLRGDLTADTSSCDPLQTHSSQQIYPCGLIANSFFNGIKHRFFFHLFLPSFSSFHRYLLRWQTISVRV
jgi:hypothetical protein